MEEKISKQKAKQLFDTGDIHSIETGTFKGLSEIHRYLFEGIYEFAGKVRDVNIAKNGFQFAPVMYLKHSLEHIERMPQHSFDEIIEKYVEMNVAHPFRDGNDRSTRIWLDLMLKSAVHSVIDWNVVDKKDYLPAMERSPVEDIEIKQILKNALTPKADDRERFMNGDRRQFLLRGLFRIQNGRIIRKQRLFQRWNKRCQRMFFKPQEKQTTRPQKQKHPALLPPLSLNKHPTTP